MADRLDYKKAGVDIQKAEEFVQIIREKIASLPQVLLFGSFASGLEIRGYREPVIMLTTDGVGTKLKIAQAVSVHNTVGIDLVAMNVNDVITSGAKPLGFMDYIAIGKLDLKLLSQLMDGIVEGCKQAQVPLIGGETAEMPDFYPPGVYDLAGFCVGVCEKEELITGKDIKPGDVILGLESSGLHSNGFSLVRKVLELRKIGYEDRVEEFGHRMVWEVLLEPTRIYWHQVKELLHKVKIKGMAHITGGGIRGNLVRILPQGTKAVVEKASIPKKSVFEWIARLGGIEEEEMYKTFNMGVGFMVVVEKEDADKVLSVCKDAFVCGEIKEGQKDVLLV